MAQTLNAHRTWHFNRRELAEFCRQGVRMAPRVIETSVRNFFANNDLLRASALTYTVALSMVPILALAFSVLKGFGGFDQLKLLLERNVPFGSSRIGDELMSYVERTNAAALGSVGGALLLVTVISTMSTIERAFNTIWRAPHERSYLRKFSDYLSVLFTVPLLMVAALTLTAVFSVRISRLPLATTLSPCLISWAAFFFLFVFFPYTRVQYGAALAGSLVAAILFQMAQWAFVRFQIGVANYQAIYGALATIPLFLVWAYTAWAIVLFGAELSATLQRGVRDPRPAPDSADFRWRAALLVLVRAGDRFRRGGPPVTALGIAAELGVEETAVKPVVDALTGSGFLVQSGGPSPVEASGLYLTRAPSAISLSEVVRFTIFDEQALNTDRRIADLLGRINRAAHEAVRALTVADLLDYALRERADGAPISGSDLIT